MEIIPKLLIYWYIVVFISTESLSYLNLITRTSIILVNLFFFALILIISIQDLKNLFRSFLKRKNLFYYVIYLILGLTFIQGMSSAPSTTDSMVYHLPRVMYWIQEKTVQQDVIRNPHDFMAPFAEYLLLHLYLIFNGDKMLFLSQWLAFAVSIVLSFLIAKRLAAPDRVAKYIML